MLRLTSYVLLLAFTLALASCGEFEKLKKRGGPDEKYAKALEYYNKGEYVRAQQLFEDLASSVSYGSERGETVLYYQAMTNYQLGDYILAGYQFGNFYRRYPLSTRAEECAYMSAYCHYLNSPPYTLDQSDTRSAITQFTFFIKQFPKSPRVAECNKLIDKLYEKLEMKSYMIAKQYFRISDYKAAIASFQNLLREFPDSKHREEIHYLMARSHYLLALNSVNEKAMERAKLAMEGAQKFKTTFKDSKYEGQVDDLYRSAQKLIERLEREKKAGS